jgi:hypothetical protein
MNSYRRSYIFGIILLGVGFYYAYKADLLEFALYGCAGITFIVNALTSEPVGYRIVDFHLHYRSAFSLSPAV